MTPIADDIENHVRLKCLAIFDRDTRGVGDSFRIITVDMQNRGLDHFSNFCAVCPRAAILRRCRKTNLVVNDNVDGPTGSIPFQLAHSETFGNNTLAGKCRVSMK